MKVKNYITPQGHKRLSDELNSLLKVERPEVTKLVQWAAGNGDRSENADYIYGKKRLREIDRRIRFLIGRLEAAEIIDPSKVTNSKVQFGATIEIQDEAGVKKSLTIVGIDEVDTEKGRISWQSPIGRSMLGKGEGDEVLVKIPNGEVSFEIISVLYQAID